MSITGLPGKSYKTPFTSFLKLISLQTISRADKACNLHLCLRMSERFSPPSCDNSQGCSVFSAVVSKVNRSHLRCTVFNGQRCFILAIKCNFYVALENTEPYPITAASLSLVPGQDFIIAVLHRILSRDLCHFGSCY